MYNVVAILSMADMVCLACRKSQKIDDMPILATCRSGTIRHDYNSMTIACINVRESSQNSRYTLTIHFNDTL